jgi:hypothetical protein
MNQLSVLMYRRERLKAAAKEVKDDNFCSVLTLALLTDHSWNDAYAALELCGRKHRTGPKMFQIWDAFDLLGFRNDRWASKYGDGRADCPRTILTATRKAPQIGRFLFDSTAHVSPFIDGELVDSQQFKLNRIIGIYEISPKDGRSKN